MKLKEKEVKELVNKMEKEFYDQLFEKENVIREKLYEIVQYYDMGVKDVIVNLENVRKEELMKLEE